MKLMTLSLLLGLTLLFAGCEQRSNRKKKSSKATAGRNVKRSKQTRKSGQRSKVGAGNVIDYATGETPLRIRNRKKNQIQKIEGKYRDRYKDQLK